MSNARRKHTTRTRLNGICRWRSHTQGRWNLVALVDILTEPTHQSLPPYPLLQRSQNIRRIWCVEIFPTYACTRKHAQHKLIYKWQIRNRNFRPCICSCLIRCTSQPLRYMEEKRLNWWISLFAPKRFYPKTIVKLPCLKWNCFSVLKSPLELPEIVFRPINGIIRYSNYQGRFIIQQNEVRLREK